MKKFLSTFLSVFSGIAAIFALTFLVLVLLGYRPFIIDSTSMEPLYQKGSLCLINTSFPLDKLEIGDVLVYRASGNMLVLHRIVDITSSGDNSLAVQMQGDANSIAQVIELSGINYVGRESLTIPGLGIVVGLLSFPFVWGMICLFIVLACIPKSALSRIISVCAISRKKEEQNEICTR